MNPGWWMVPTVVSATSAVLFAWYWFSVWAEARRRGHYGLGTLADLLLGVVVSGFLVMLVLLAWLIWALLN